MLSCKLKSPAGILSQCAFDGARHQRAVRGHLGRDYICQTQGHQAELLWRLPQLWSPCVEPGVSCLLVHPGLSSAECQEQVSISCAHLQVRATSVSSRWTCVLTAGLNLGLLSLTCTRGRSTLNDSIFPTWLSPGVFLGISCQTVATNCSDSAPYLRPSAAGISEGLL